jgi:hypothetical protein
MSKSLTNSAPPKVAGKPYNLATSERGLGKQVPSDVEVSPQSNPAPALTRAGGIKRRNPEFHNRDSRFSPSTPVDK